MNLRVRDYLASFVYAGLQLLQIIISIVTSLILTYIAYFVVTVVPDLFLSPDTLSFSMDRLIEYAIMLIPFMIAVTVILYLFSIPTGILTIIYDGLNNIICFFLKRLNHSFLIIHVLRDFKFKKMVIVVVVVLTILLFYQWFNIYDFNLNFISNFQLSA